MKYYWKVRNKLKKIINLLTYRFRILSKDYILIDTPTHGNLGDHAIVMAVQQMINEHNQSYIELTAVEINCREKWFAWITPSKKTILIPGGGFLGSIWPEEEDRVKRILEAFKKNKIIVFPQTVTFDMKTEKDKKYFEESHKIYAAHKDLTVFVREKKSLAFMNQYMPEVNTFLMPDVVTYLNVQLDARERSDILFCMRADREKAIKNEDLSAIYELVVKKYPNQRIDHTDTVICQAVLADEREREVQKKLAQFGSAKLVLTDRLHGMIFAAITNTPCIAMSNSNGKVKGVYDWISGNKYIIYVDNMEEFASALDKLDIDRKYQYNRGSIKKAFVPLFKLMDEKD